MTQKGGDHVFKWLSERQTVLTAYLLAGIIFVAVLERLLVSLLGQSLIWWLALAATVLVTYLVLREYLFHRGWTGLVSGLIVALFTWLTKQMLLVLSASPAVVWAMMAFVFIAIAYCFVSLLIGQRSGGPVTD